MSLLRELVNEEAFRADPAKALLDAALLVRRSGLVHLVDEATRPEVLALAKAGELLEAERAVLVARAIAHPAGVARVFDGGRNARDELLELAADVAAETERGRRM